MPRPKTLKKPRRKPASKLSFRMISGAGWSTGTGGSGGISIFCVQNSSSTHTLGDYYVRSAETGARLVGVNERCIESLDEGVTWHTADTMDPASNINGQLMILSSPCGTAPESMRPGSGCYSFVIEQRMATPAEREAWMASNQERLAQNTLNAQFTLADAIHYTDQEERRRQALLQEEAAASAERAKARARELLLSNLTDEQRVDFEKHKGFWVRSQHGYMYWVTPSTAVRMDEEGRALQRYCIHAVDGQVPADDNALMRKLLLECNEDEFIRTANAGTPGRHDLGLMIETQPAVQSGTRRRARRAVLTWNSSAQAMFWSGSADYIALPLDPCPILVYVNGIVRPLS